jgi:hypothetical protein
MGVDRKWRFGAAGTVFDPERTSEAFTSNYPNHRILLLDPVKTAQGLSCAPGVEREISSSSSFMSADTSPKRGVLK